jgi:hypothetical protein
MRVAVGPFVCRYRLRSNIEIVVPIETVLRGPSLQNFLEVIQEERLVLIDDNGCSGMTRLDVDEAVCHAGSADTLANQLGEVNELERFLRAKMYQIGSDLESCRLCLSYEEAYCHGSDSFPAAHWVASGGKVDDSGSVLMRKK